MKGNPLQRRMARGTSIVSRDILEPQGVADLFRAGGGQRGERSLRMNIPQRPDQELVLVLAGTPVAGGTAARRRPKHLRDRVGGPDFVSGQSRVAKREKR
jgi:hypothetical protein